MFSDEAVKVGFGSTEGKSTSYKKSFTWNPKTTSLVSAMAHIDASQTYLSGASLDIFVNGNIVKTISWAAFENEDQKITVDVSSDMFNGDNTFELDYKTAYGVLSDQIATVTMDVLVNLDTTETSNPLSTGNTSNSSFWANLVNNMTTIGIIVLVVGITAVAIWQLAKRSYFGKIAGGIRSLIRI